MYVLFLFSKTIQAKIKPKKVRVKLNMVENENENDSENDEELEPNILYFMFAPWCMHSKRAKPMWEELKSLLEDNSGIKLMLVDSETENGKKIIKDFEVTSFPTFILHTRDDEVIPYSGKRSASAIIDFLDEHE
tara:strand:+ start:297 stop:698 length:402 start_codon:yes stop_codon:yes gene_type:complete